MSMNLLSDLTNNDDISYIARACNDFESTTDVVFRFRKESQKHLLIILDYP